MVPHAPRRAPRAGWRRHAPARRRAPGGVPPRGAAASRPTRASVRWDRCRGCAHVARRGRRDQGHAGVARHRARRRARDDPGWTPLFLTASALVMEMGGMMSHGAVVAREYGIPAVVGVPDATTRIATGERIVVDGSAGTVALEGPEEH
ncbi:MAG: hypothetical protein E6J82_18930 [Deltaproteobacteria bacterium]|nr:MAG: hypothetical protein E6J82_18930 [Deltaproteobacteria bacterium]